MRELDRLEEGQSILVDGDKFVSVSSDLAASFRPGDRVFVDRAAGELLHVPSRDSEVARRAVSDALDAWQRLRESDVDQRTEFFRIASGRLAADAVWQAIQRANEQDILAAREKKRPTNRLQLSDSIRA